MMNDIDVTMFWDIDRTQTYNCLFNFIVGTRGGGKSYGAKKKAVKNFLRKGEQFGYIRRYKDDLKEPLETFWKDIGQEFPDHECMVSGNKVYIRIKPANKKEKWTEKDIAGYGFFLSTANNKKSISYPDITMLIFDEFLLEEGNQRYLKREVNNMLNLYETVARPGSGHKRVTLWMLANAITITNPYFLYWDLKMAKKQDKNGKWIWKHPTKSLLVEEVSEEKFMLAKKATEFGGIVEGTPYGDFSTENKFLLDDDTFIEKRTPTSRHYFNFQFKGEKYGVWYDYSVGKMWVSYAVDPSAITYSLTMDDHSPNTMFLKQRNKTVYFRKFLECYTIGVVRFETMNIKNICQDVLRMTLY